MILHIDSSPQHPSVSRELSAEVVRAILALEGSSEVIHHDLAAENVPHLTRHGVIPIRTSVAHTPEQRTSQVLSDGYTSELEAADTLVIGAPMYNFGIPSTLKAWFDEIAARPAVQRGVEVLAGLRRPLMDATARETLFGSTQYQPR